MDTIYEMETQDPDDLFALALLCHHPVVNLRGVVVTPGSKHQVAIITEALRQLGKPDVMIGSFNINHTKSCVSPWWTSFLGDDFDSSIHANEGWTVIDLLLKEHPDSTIITGSPIKNLGRFVKNYDIFRIDRWVAQGGFAGDNIVPEEWRLDKFKGRVTCPTFNFNGDPESARSALLSPYIDKKILVSKNVCHGFAYNRDTHDRFHKYKDDNPGSHMIYWGMDRYLDKRKEKLFHDPLAVCVAIDDTIATLLQVEAFREKGEWGCKKSENSNTWITIHVDHDRAFQVLSGSTVASS